MLDTAHQRLREFAAAADRLRHAEAVHQTRHEVQAEPGTELIRHLQVLRHQAQQPHLDLFALERLVGDLERAALHGVQYLAALLVAIQHRHERTQRRGRNIQAGGEHGQHGHRALGEASVGFRIPGGDPRDLLAGPVQILVGDQGGLIRKDHGVGDVISILEPEAALQAELIAPDHGIALNHDVHTGVLVMPVAGGIDLARHHSAAGPGLALQDQDFLAGFRQVGRRDQAIVARPHCDDIIRLHHSPPSTPSQRCQCASGRPATGARKYGMVLPIKLPRYTVRRSGPPKVTLAIQGAMVPLVAAMISGVMVPL